MNGLGLGAISRSRRSARRAWLAPLALTSALIACDGDPEIAPKLDPDRFRECNEDGADQGDLPGCAVGEICLEGRCYRACTSAAECGPTETCSSGGACVTGGAMHDGGMTDPCASVTCDAPQVCHPIALSCVECSERTVGVAGGEPGACPATAPICDIANGLCRPFAPRQCAPCNAERDCNDATFAGSCIARDVMGTREQICLLPCPTDGSACPNGLECDPDLMRCVPPVGVPCTNWRAAVDRATCLDDETCAPLGASAAVYPGSCDGEDTTIDPPTNGVCLQPCGDTADCFDSAGGQQCLGEGTALFCRVPPVTP